MKNYYKNKPETSLTRDKFIDEIDKFEKSYYLGSDSISLDSDSKISIKNKTSMEAEKEAEKLLNKEELNEKDIRYAIAWKAGKVDKDGKIVEEEGGLRNGYGSPIKKEELDSYIEYVIEKQSEIKEMVNGDDWDIDKMFNLLSQNTPKNFGSVYIFNLLFFISNGKLPIYDKFAHKAIKALYFGIHPSEVYVGDAPSKSDAEAAANLYKEYMLFLELVFGEEAPGIPRKLDRALWVYGHNTKNPKTAK